MKEIIVKSKSGNGITDEELRGILEESIFECRANLKKVLLVPPDLTRMHSGAGKISALYYEMLKDSCRIDIMPALGTHEPMTPSEIDEFFGGTIPHDALIEHNWRTDVVKIGQVPADYVKEVSEGLVSEPIDVEVNKRILDKSYDIIISIGQVVPHEVAGMANYNKNIFVGLGGGSMINRTHMLGAVYGLERIMGRDHSPVRKVFDYAERHFAMDIPIMYVLTVTTEVEGKAFIHGVFTGRNRRIFEEAVSLSLEKNIIFLDKPIKKAVVYLDEKEFKSAWLGNKAIYRTRMAIDDGGELVILAPGVRKFGEDDEYDRLIRKYGYIGREKILELCRQEEDLKNNLSVAAHLVHGSSDGRFAIVYAPGKLAREEVEGVNFKYASPDDTIRRYDPGRLKDGFNITDDGEEIYYIGNPAVGLWAYRDRFWNTRGISL
ncbi:MAG: lactate racemase domain-containing protein [Bacillota bacterium]